MPTKTDPPKSAPIDRRAERREERRRAIEESDMPDSTKHLLYITQDHSDDELDVYNSGFDKLTKVALTLGTLLILGIIALAGVQVSYGNGTTGTLSLTTPASAATPEKPKVDEVDPSTPLGSPAPTP